MSYKYMIHYSNESGDFRSYTNNCTKNKQLLRSLLKRPDVRICGVYVNNKPVKIKHIFKQTS